MIRKTVINTVALDLNVTLAFYQRLGFVIIEMADTYFAVDCALVIRINVCTASRLGVSLFNDNWNEYSSVLKDAISLDAGQRKLISDSTGCHILLEQGAWDIPVIPTSSILGNYAGVSLEAIEFDRCKDVWEGLGFQAQSGARDQAWVSMSSSDYGTISIMKANSCPHIFTNPSLTYFNGVSNLDVIQKVKDLGISIAEEITQFNPSGKLDNIILKDPAGLTFLIFND